MRSRFIIIGTLLLVGTSYATPAASQDTDLTICKGIPMSERIVIVEDVITPKQDIRDIAVSRHTGYLYIVNDSNKLLVKKGEKARKRIDVIETNVHSIAADKYAAKLYISCDTGLTIYDEITEEVVANFMYSDIYGTIFVPENSTEIYGVTMEENEVYYHKNVLSQGVKLDIELYDNDGSDGSDSDYENDNGYVSDFVVDNIGNYYYTIDEDEYAETKLLLKGHSQPYTYNTSNHYTPMAIDVHGRVYGIADKGLYILNAHNENNPWLVAMLDYEPSRMVFDKNNMYFIEENRILRAKFHDKCFSPIN